MEGGGTAFLLLERFRGARGATAAAQTAAAAMVTAQAFPPSRPTTRCKPIVVVVDVVIAVTAIRNGPIVRVCGATAKGGSAREGEERRCPKSAWAAPAVALLLRVRRLLNGLVRGLRASIH